MIPRGKNGRPKPTHLLLLVSVLLLSTAVPASGASSARGAPGTAAGPAAAHGNLSVLVVNEQSDPVVGATVSVPGVAPLTTPANGTVRFFLVPGSVAVSAYAMGYLSAHGNATVVSGRTQGIALTLGSPPPPPTYSVAFEVLNHSSGEAIEGASVVFDREPIGTTDAQGVLYASNSYAAGTYLLNVTAAGYTANDTSVTVAGASVFTIDLNSTYTGPPPGGILEGSYFPWDATLLIDGTPVVGSRHADGGAGFELNLSAGTHAWKMSYEDTTEKGTFQVLSDTLSWVHFTGVNASGSTPPTTSNPNDPSSSSTQFLEDVAAGFVAAVVAALVVMYLVARRGSRKSPRPSTPSSETLSQEAPREEHGHAGGDPEETAGPRDPGA
jgi:hypothetical protein